MQFDFIRNIIWIYVTFIITSHLKFPVKLSSIYCLKNYHWHVRKEVHFRAGPNIFKWGPNKVYKGAEQARRYILNSIFWVYYIQGEREERLSRFLLSKITHGLNLTDFAYIHSLKMTHRFSTNLFHCCPLSILSVSWHRIHCCQKKAK